MADWQRNVLLRAARECLPSSLLPGEPLTRPELAEMINAWLWEQTGTRYALDDHAIARWERGRVHWPVAPYRTALRAVLGVATDADLGFRPPAARPTARAHVTPVGAWSSAAIVQVAAEAMEHELINRREAMRGAAVASGAALLRPLAGWLEPLVPETFTVRRGAFSPDEVTALENIVTAFRGWRTPGSGLGRTAVVGQLSDVAQRLDGAPGGPLTDRVFLATAELAKIAGSMAFDEGFATLAQRHYVTAVQMAKAADNPSFGAVVVAALARQAFDVGRTTDGVELIALAQRGSDRSATPALRATLATREAWGYALSGSTYRFQRAVEAAENAYADVDLGAEPRWLHGLDRAELAGVIGARYRDLARHDPGQVRHAVTYTERALKWRDPSRLRNIGFDLVSLARVHLMTGEHDRAAATVRRALPLLDTRRPGRLARKLTDWRREAAPFVSVPVVRETCADIANLITA